MANRLFLIVLLVSLAFRLFLSPMGNHHDLLTNANWGMWLHFNGTRSFYENTVWIYDWPTQLPVMNLVYAQNWDIYEAVLLKLSYFTAVIKNHNLFPNMFTWLFSFTDWFKSLYGETPFPNGFLITMKFPPIFSDIFLAIIVYVIYLKNKKKLFGLLVSSSFLIFPFSWYTSSLWGQYDQVSVLLILLSFLVLYFINNKLTQAQTLPVRSLLFTASCLLFFLGTSVKPNALLISPFFVFYFLYSKPRIEEIISSLVSVVLVFYFTTTLFVPKAGVVSYAIDSIFPIVFNKVRLVTATNVFNFWQMIFPFSKSALEIKLLFVPILYIGYALVLVFNIIASFFALKHKNNLKTLLVSLFIATSGSYFFATGMLDRYFYPTVFLLSFLPLLSTRRWIYWVITSLVFSLNLFLSWGYPKSFGFKEYFWDNKMMIFGFSFVNLILYLSFVKGLKNEK